MKFHIDELGIVYVNNTPMPECLTAENIADAPEVTLTEGSMTFFDADPAKGTSAGATASAIITQGDLSFPIMEYAIAEKSDTPALDGYKEERFPRRVIFAIDIDKDTLEVKKVLAAVESRFTQGYFTPVPPFDND